MIYTELTASKVAEFLLQIKAIVLSPDDPFTWASGWNSPIYCDNRKTLSYPKIRTFLRQEMASAIVDKFGKPDVIAGVATGGIAQGALIAQELGLPFVYVRSSPKGHGMTNLIEGVIEKGQTVVVVEDLISTGGSSLKAVKALREAGCKVTGMTAIFTYAFDAAVEAFEENECELVTLSDYHYVIERAADTGYISTDQTNSLKSWRSDPSIWKK